MYHLVGTQTASWSLGYFLAPYLRTGGRSPGARTPYLRGLIIFAALVLSMLISAQGADATLKSEWRFGGNVARTILALPFGSATGDGIFGRDAFGDLGDAGTFVRPQAAQPTGGSLGGLFNRPGVVGGFAAGFLGSGLLGLVFGHGLVSELSGAASVMGLVFQLALIVMLARLIWTWWRADRGAAFPEMSPRQLADAYGRPRNEVLPDIDSLAETDSGSHELADGHFEQKD